MIELHPELGYPPIGELNFRIDYFVQIGKVAGIEISKSEGGFLFVGKDKNGKVYEPRREPKKKGIYVLPSGKEYPVQEGTYPAIHFPFMVDSAPTYREILTNGGDHSYKLWEKLDLKVMDESFNKISLEFKIEDGLKQYLAGMINRLVILCRLEDRLDNQIMRFPEMEDFLEKYRKK